MTLAQQYKELVDELFINPCEESFDCLEKFEQENMISHGMLENSGWSCLYSQQMTFCTHF